MACPWGLDILPVITISTFLATFFICYAIAVGKDHVEAGFPYISDTGTYSPESCIFGQMLNICAVLVCLNVYVRYKQVAEFSQYDNHMTRWNRASLTLGCISAFGISVVGNFQESNVLIVHLTGAILAFGIGTIYCCVNTFMSFRSRPQLSTNHICYIRLAICLTSLAAFVTTFTLDGFAKSKFHGTNPKKWYPKDGGFVDHVVSSATEWLMAMCMMAYFITFIPDFRRMSLSSPEVSLRVLQFESGGLLVDNDLT